MFQLLKAKIAPYFSYILIAVFLAMAVAIGALGKLYSNKVQEYGELEEKLKQRDAEVKVLTDQLNLERDSRASIRVSEEILDVKYEGIKDDAKEISDSEELHALDPDAVSKLLCANGLATDKACGKANRSRDNTPRE